MNENMRTSSGYYSQSPIIQIHHFRGTCSASPRRGLHPGIMLLLSPRQNDVECQRDFSKQLPPTLCPRRPCDMIIKLSDELRTTWANTVRIKQYFVDKSSLQVHQKGDPLPTHSSGSRLAGPKLFQSMLVLLTLESQ